MKKKKANKLNSAAKEAEQTPNSSPVCYANSKDLRPGYQDDQEKTVKKQ